LALEIFKTSINFS